MHHACPNAYEVNTTEDYMTQLKEDSKAIAKKVQMYSPMYNPTYYKYHTSQSKVSRFDFPKSMILAFHIDHNELIQQKQDNI